MNTKLFKNLVDDILASLNLFTLLTIPRSGNSAKRFNYSRAQWSFPLVGLLVGLITLLITKLICFIGLNLVIASTFGVLSNLLIFGFLQKQPQDEFKEIKSISYISFQSIGYKGLLLFIILIYLKINLISELLKFDGFSYMIIGSYALGTFSILSLRKMNYQFFDNDLLKIINKPSNNNLLIATSIVFLILFPLGLIITIILLVTTFATTFFINIYITNSSKKNLIPLACHIQTFEIIALIILSIWFAV